MTDLHVSELEIGSWKTGAIVLAAALALLGGVVWGAYSFGRRSVDVDTETRRAEDAIKREAKAKTQAAEAGRLASVRLDEVERLRQELGKRPVPPPPDPVDPNASAVSVAGDLQGLGLRPVLLGEDPALGLALADGRTVLTWGRQAQRVPPLVARLETLEELGRAQTSAAEALRLQVSGLGTALAACDEGRDAERQRAKSLAPDRPWSVGLLVGIDTTGTRRVGAYVSRAWGPIHVQGVVLGNQAALGAGFRF